MTPANQPQKPDGCMAYGKPCAAQPASGGDELEDMLSKIRIYGGIGEMLVLDDEIKSAIATAIRAWALRQSLAVKDYWPEHKDMKNTEQTPTPNWIFGYNHGQDDYEAALKAAFTGEDT